MNNSPVILLETQRNGYSDLCFYGSVFYAKNPNEIYSFGLNSSEIAFMRSLAKPLQASIMADSNIIKDYDFSSKMLAIFCASHSGSPEHIKLLKEICEKYKISENMLELEPQNPLDLENFNGNKTKLHNNCSGKHIMMVLNCLYNGFNHKNYTNPNHPIQILIKNKQNELSGYNSEILTFDGCSTPLWGLPYKNIIKAYFNLFNDDKYKIILKSIIENPYIFGGNNRFDTEIIKLGKGNLFSKVGAGGFVLVYNIKLQEILMVKMTQNNNDARRLITLDLLNKLNWINSEKIEYEYNQKKQKVARYIYNLKLNI